MKGHDCRLIASSGPTTAATLACPRPLLPQHTFLFCLARPACLLVCRCLPPPHPPSLALRPSPSHLISHLTARPRTSPLARCARNPHLTARSRTRRSAAAVAPRTSQLALAPRRSPSHLVPAPSSPPTHPTPPPHPPSECTCDLLAERPEQEGTLMTMAVNKLGDPDRKVTTRDNRVKGEGEGEGQV